MSEKNPKQTNKNIYGTGALKRVLNCVLKMKGDRYIYYKSINLTYLYR